MVYRNVRPAVGRVLEGKESKQGEKQMLKTRIANHEFFKGLFGHGR
jgi:hypothetical protein